MKDKNAHFAVEGAAEAHGVAAGDCGRDGDVSEVIRRGKTCGPRTARLMMRSCSCGFWLGAICWEGQYIGRTDFSTEGAIPTGDLRVGNQGNGERTRREAQAFAGSGEEFFQARNGNTNAALTIENHAREFNPAESAAQDVRRVRRLSRDRCDEDGWRRARRTL